jgi:hypothetical protein
MISLAISRTVASPAVVVIETLFLDVLAPWNSKILTKVLSKRSPFQGQIPACRV